MSVSAWQSENPDSNETWKDDKLGREEEADFLTQYLLSKYDQSEDRESFVLSLSADLGMGKTYFIRNWSTDLMLQNHPVVMFNAWENDFSDEPLLALLSELGYKLTRELAGVPKGKALLDDVITHAKKLIKPSESVVTSLLTNTLNGLSQEDFKKLLVLEDEAQKPDANEESKGEFMDMLSTIAPAASAQSLLHHKNTKESIGQFKESLQKLIEFMDKDMAALKLPMFIFVDELELCRPEYTIELLEKVKHLFSIRGIYFIVATDTNQLEHAIKSVYGQNADTSGSQKQLFDQEYKLIEPKRYQFAEYLFHKHKIDADETFFTPLSVNYTMTRNIHVDLFAIMSKYFKLTLTDQVQICSILKVICMTWKFDEKAHLLYMLYLLMLQHCDPELFEKYAETNTLAERNAFIKSNDFKKLVDQSVIIKTSHSSKDGIHAPEEKEKFDNVLNKYIEYSAKSKPEIAKSSNPKLKIYSVIRDELIHDLPKQYAIDAPPRHNLGKYFDLVRKASHLVKQ